MNTHTLEQLISAINGRKYPQGEFSTATFESVQLDSRNCRPGDLFWAVRGENQDGHNFIADAIKRGAVAAVVSQPLHKPFPQIVVEDTHSALGQFANWHRSQQSGMVIGVTGSVGKTTTRHMIHTVLSGRYRGVQSLKNFNNQFGVPLSLLSMSTDDEFAVIEIAASAPGEVAALGKITEHEVAVITSIAEAHLAGFGSLERVLDSKCELIDTLSESGFAILNGDDPRLLEYSERLDKPFYLCGYGPQNHFQIESVEMSPTGMTFEINGQEFQIPVLGRHFLNAAAISVAIATEFGLEVEEIQSGLSEFQPISGRCAPLQIGTWTVIDDTYNASPRSMHAACRVLAEWPDSGPEKILVAGDMLELGQSAVQHHRHLGHTIADSSIDFLIAHGEFSECIASAAVQAGMPAHRVAVCDSFETVEIVMDCWLKPKDVVLVKGSRAMKMERVLDLMVDLNRHNEVQHSRKMLKAA
ncbi:MAG: UDP-N-acetylmuramoyl-tripeptide--D-alanyl-D-alanine ligase [Planctomycetaceae bacterium]|jgi:UDP-N-acetylmuramoyl-tripeptide--D-alanyl-D-alanine ligase|nr:UDP-N-acetylmuramoyl-tripeptide--D-alanyl-D-alanine ligase [Planctomycetaceae bacterium]MDG2389966.1 UDP-N-acetylmuramoyl-tripeptide--D-alanyl-D-alanine ligase [Planctomycetaceae bacterium]